MAIIPRYNNLKKKSRSRTTKKSKSRTTKKSKSRTTRNNAKTNYSRSRKNSKNSKNIKRVSLKKHHHAHKKNNFFHSRGRHNTGSSSGGTNMMRGGMVSSPAAGPIGSPWQGGNNITPTPNHFAHSPNGIEVGGTQLARSTSGDFITKPPMGGGNRKTSRVRGKGGVGGSNVQKGGFFQEILNLGRGAQYGLNGGYFDLTGKTQPLSQNPYPSVQPLSNGGGPMSGISSTPDMRQVYINANNQVAKV